MNDLFVFAVSLILGISGAYLISRYGHVLKLTDMPSERSSHTRPTPKGGGIGIFLAFVSGSIIVGVNPYIWVSAAVLSIISFYGDFRHVSRRLRLVIQMIAAGVCVLCISPNLSFFMILLWVFFIAATANFYNFMDGINGIAGITAIIASILLFIYTDFVIGMHLSVFLAIGFGCIGFLPFNIPFAKVFMGDVGSILIGFWYGFSVFVYSGSCIEFVSMIAFMLPFYVDSISTIILRIKRGENIAQPHRSHIYQILANQAGIAHWKVSLSYGFGQLIMGLIYIVILRSAGNITGMILVVFFICVQLLLFFWIRLRFETSPVLKKVSA